MTENVMKKEFVSVWVRDPRIQRGDFWHTYVNYEICIHTNSMCFRKKTSCVRRRYSEFVWLRQRLQDNDLLMEVPKLPPWNPFFSLTNTNQVTQRMEGLQQFLEGVLRTPILLSDSRLHLFLQSQLSVAKMEACVQGLTRYTVAQAIQRCVCDTRRFPLEEEEREEEERRSCCDSDSESTTSSGLGHSVEPATPNTESSSPDRSPTHTFESPPTDTELFSCLSSSPSNEQDGIQSITDYRTPPRVSDSNASLPNAHNTFYARFEAPNTKPARKTRVDPHKAAGPDSPGRVLKACADQLANVLMDLLEPGCRPTVIQGHHHQTCAEETCSVRAQ
ncbi:sorting nexin-10A [Chanos chanos]|uniref:Sorting nexin-10A n=1 Tax=Chanos chanos TaxID=29144 RepID=A0A6J2WLH5_CHACN|nr:sorting nexin-10A-like [Chanos chanos]